MTLSSRVLRLPAAIALSTCVLVGCTVRQILVGQIYRIATPPVGACPGLVWRFFVDAKNQIHGDLSQVGSLPTADLSGVLGADDRFNIVVKDYRTHHTATAAGQFTASVSTILIRGDGAGAVCDGRTFDLRLGAYFSRQGGGGGGGG